MARSAPAAALLGVLLVLLTSPPAHAQDPSPSPFSAPRLRDTPRLGYALRTELSTTASHTAWTAPTARTRLTKTTGASASELPSTGADPLRLALAGLTLLALGLALRSRVASADVPHPF